MIEIYRYSKVGIEKTERERGRLEERMIVI